MACFLKIHLHVILWPIALLFANVSCLSRQALGVTCLCFVTLSSVFLVLRPCGMHPLCSPRILLNSNEVCVDALSL
jgi:hypothetical protein